MATPRNSTPWYGRPDSRPTTRGSTSPSAKDDQGRILHQRGVTPSPGLYMLGLTWQHTRTSALLGWVGNDAAFLAERIAARTDEGPNIGPAARTSAASPGVQAAG